MQPGLAGLYYVEKGDVAVAAAGANGACPRKLAPLRAQDRCQEEKDDSENRKADHKNRGVFGHSARGQLELEAAEADPVTLPHGSVAVDGLPVDEGAVRASKIADPE